MDAAIFVENLKSNFHVNTNIDDVTFEKCKIEPYTFLESEHYFGEKDCLMYSTEVNIFNVKFSLKFLSFVYATHGEVLKLEIAIHNALLDNEIGRCRNFLQRKRNLNQTMDTLVKIAELYETRRLICRTVFQKHQHVALVNSNDGITIKCFHYESRTKLLEVCWSISWNVEDCEVTDFIEFYCNHSVLKKDRGKEVQNKIDNLVQVGLSFQTQLKLWKSLMTDLYPKPQLFAGQNVIQSNAIFEISDSDSEDDHLTPNLSVTTRKKPLRRCPQVKDEILVID